MSGEKRTLLLLLAGPMQAWGSRSRFDDRDTGLEPTKSGVVGMLCAACGVPRDDAARLRRFNSLTFGVRVEAPGRVMTDYHTAQNVIKADGSGKTNVQSRRHFLADARFLVGLETADAELLEDIIAGLRRPKWPLSLGRKSFPLALPPLLWKQAGGSLRDKPLEAALKTEPWYRVRPFERDPESLRLIIEDEKEGAQTLSDAPLSFVSEDRRFGLRRVRPDVLWKGGADWPRMENHPCLEIKP